MTKRTRGRLTLVAAAAALATAPAWATNGYFSHGYGLKGMGMGGASLALSQDAFGGANNPATMVWAGSRLDLGVNAFMPSRDAERSGAGMPTLNGKVDSDSNLFFIPEFGYNRMLGSDASVGVSVYGNGGLNTDYPQGSFNCGGGAANMLCGSGRLGVDLMQLVIAPTYSLKLAPDHAVGASLLLGYQRFRAEGLQAFDNAPGFPAFTGSPGNVTNRGYDSATGAGLRIGYAGRPMPGLTLGAAYSTKISMGRFDKYRGLFAENGDFDVPSNWGVGLAVETVPGLTVALDYQRINYTDVASVSNASLPAAPLGAANGPGFGWQDIGIWKLGVAWRATPSLTLRAGYNRGENPIRPVDVTFNILAPGVVTSHYTLGLTLQAGPTSEFTAMFMHAPRVDVSGASLFNAFMGGAAGNEKIGMSQNSFAVGWSWKY